MKLSAPVLSRRHLLLGAAGLAGLTAATTLSGCSSDKGATISVLTYDSFELPEELITEFETDTGYTLEFLPVGSGGELVNKLILTKDAPLGDAVFGIDNTYASRAIDEGVIDTGIEITLPGGADDYLANDSTALAPIDVGDVCLNIDTVWFEENGITPPLSFEDLLEPEYKDLLVAIDPSTSSTGMGWLLATVGHFGADGFAEYWAGLMDNGAKIVSSWSDAYYTDFSGGEGQGDYPIVVSYSSSPSYTVLDDGTNTTAALLNTAFRQVEYAGVIAGAEHTDGAKAFIEWLLTEEVQEAIPENLYMYPVNPKATLPESLEKYGPLAGDPERVTAEEISANRETWLTTWAEAVGQ